MNYLIGEFSQKVGLSIDTLRYYEKEQLILPKRNESNRRIYDEADVAWIEFIKRLKQIGMPIKKIKEYAQLRHQGASTIEARMTLLSQQQDVLLQQKAELEQNSDFLLKKIETYQKMLTENA